MSGRKPKTRPYILGFNALMAPYFAVASFQRNTGHGIDWYIIIAAWLSIEFFRCLVDTARAVLLEHREESVPKPITVRHV